MKSSSHHQSLNSPGKPGLITYSREQLQRAVSIYSSSFGDDVPLGLLTAAASAFRSRELMSILLDRVQANKPVQNWNEFTDGFINDSPSIPLR